MTDRPESHGESRESRGGDVGSGDVLALDAALKAVEATVRAGGRPGTLRLDELRALARSHPERAQRLARRLDRVFATSALRSRDLPAGLLDGLYDDVRSAAADDRFGRARMSTAFLDAPRHLVVWRRMAVAATVLLAVGGVWTAMRDPELRPSRNQPLEIDTDPRYELIEVMPTPGGFSAPAGLVDPKRTNEPEMIYVDGDEWLTGPGIARPDGARPGVRGR